MSEKIKLDQYIYKIIYPYIWLRDHYRNFLSRRSWKYFYKYLDEPNIHTEAAYKKFFEE